MYICLIYFKTLKFVRLRNILYIISKNHFHILGFYYTKITTVIKTDSFIQNYNFKFEY